MVRTPQESIPQIELNVMRPVWFQSGLILIAFRRFDFKCPKSAKKLRFIAIRFKVPVKYELLKWSCGSKELDNRTWSYERGNLKLIFKSNRSNNSKQVNFNYFPLTEFNCNKQTKWDTINGSVPTRSRESTVHLPVVQDRLCARPLTDFT